MVKLIVHNDKWKKEIYANRHRKVFHIYKDAIDVISGVPPYQPFSLGRKAKDYNDNLDMWLEAIRAVREVLFKTFIFENMKGLSPGSGRKGQVQSPWNMLHPGRSWAKKPPADPKDQETLRRLVRYHIETNKLLQKR